MKKIITFSIPSKPIEVREYEADGEKPRRYEIDQVIFSTAYNRNRCFVQVAKFLSFANKLEKIGTDINHDLTLTDGQYIPAAKAGYTRIWSEIIDGEMEIRGTFACTDPRIIDIIDQITAPSVELMVDERTGIINENGEYYNDFEWVGTAQLTGVLAGSGDARNLETRQFNLNLEPITTMSEDQINQLLQEQQAIIDAQIQELKKEFAEVVSQSQSKTESVYEWTDEAGNKYRSTSQEVSQSIEELIEKGTMGGAILEMMKSKKYDVIQAEPVEGEGEETVTKDETEEAKDELSQPLEEVEAAEFKARQKQIQVFNQLPTNEDPDESNAADGDVDEKKGDDLPSFYRKYNNI